MKSVYRDHTDSSVRRLLSERAELNAPLRLFRAGNDTIEIARILRISEAEAHKRVFVAISQEKGRKVHYVSYGVAD